MNELFQKFLNKKITVFLKSGRRFSGELLHVEEEFLELDDRFVGLKIIALDTIENLELWSTKNDTKTVAR